MPNNPKVHYIPANPPKREKRVGIYCRVSINENWNKRSIEWILSNEKYTGNVELLKSSKSEVHYLASGSHPAIISKEVFEMVQMEKGRRSNVVRDENGVVKRKDSKYSSKK